MSDVQVTIVTDGGIDFPPEVMSDLDIAIVPSQFQVGKLIYESNQQTSLRAISQEVAGAKKVKALPLSHVQFLETYQRLSPSPIISIHSANYLGEISHAARLARNLLAPQVNVKVFEAKTIDLGVSFLVTVAARAAQEGYEQEQILLLLSRLQDEMMHTMILTKDISRLERYLRLQGWGQSVRSKLPGVENLIVVDKGRGVFTLIAQGRGLSRTLGRQADLFADVAKPSDVWFRHRGFDRQIEDLGSQLAAILRSERLRVEGEGIGASFLGASYLEVLLHPPQEEVERVQRFVRRMWRAFGTTISTSV